MTPKDRKPTDESREPAEGTEEALFKAVGRAASKDAVSRPLQGPWAEPLEEVGAGAPTGFPGAVSQGQALEAPPARVRTARRRPPSLFWPLLLISAGVLLLLSNLGYVPWSSWNVLWRLWPLLLIGLGIDALIGRRTTGGMIVSGLLILLLLGGAIALIFLARNIPGLADLSHPVQEQIRHILH
jgi:hypothetical protein